ncbi:MAG: (2Fe-2S)-binding protein [Chromatiales bacterium]|jgi:bacterioferritin-associated ferredoxin
MYVCICNAVTDGEIREAVGEGARSLDALGRKLKVATCCGRCSDCARRILDEAIGESPCAPSATDFAAG